MSPARLRAYVLIAIRDFAIPAGGLFLCLYLPLAHIFQPWHLPLLAGMLGVPLVGRGGQPPPDPRGPEDARPEPEG
jgi:hypothetical protein